MAVMNSRRTVTQVRALLHGQPAQAITGHEVGRERALGKGRGFELDAVKTNGQRTAASNGRGRAKVRACWGAPARGW
jgi:hypothetical protein